jgi:hypothetical protein
MRARFWAILWMVILTFTFVGLLLFATIHWHNFWSFFVVIPCILAFFVPNLCLNYTPTEELDTTHIHWDAATTQNCRELGWTLAAILLLSSYGIPVLAWYNAGFAWPGAMTVHIALTLLIWAYMLWLRVFGPFKNQ